MKKKMNQLQKEVDDDMQKASHNDNTFKWIQFNSIRYRIVSIIRMNGGGKNEMNSNGIGRVKGKWRRESEGDRAVGWPGESSKNTRKES